MISEEIMKWFDNTANGLQAGTVYTHQQLIALLKKDYPYVSPNSYQWAIQELLKSERIIRTGYNRYEVSGGTQKPAYKPLCSELAARLIATIEDKYPDGKFVVIEAAQINEFLESAVDNNTMIIQTEKEMGTPIFRCLQEQGYAGLLYRPTRKLYDLYSSSKRIIIANLVSESPLNHRKQHEVCIEKLIVDMFCDKYVGWIYDRNSFQAAFELAAEKYLIEKPKLLRYAKRRGVDKELTIAFPAIFGKELADMAKRGREDDLLQAAANIISTLPSSQKDTYIFINACKLTQGEIARMLKITPQAITRRINRLYNTLVRRLQSEYGFSEEEITRVSKGKAIRLLVMISRQDVDIEL